MMMASTAATIEERRRPRAFLRILFLEIKEAQRVYYQR